MEAQLLKPFSKWTNLKNTKEFTELPSYAINKVVPEDTFFTNKLVAKECFNTLLNTLSKNKINIKNYIFIEPSAGDGCFYDLLPKGQRIALDINPRKEYIKNTNYLTWYPSKKIIILL